MAIDSRIIKVGITINDELREFDGIAITAQGSKFASATQNETTIKIANLDKDSRNFLATEGSPFNRINQRKRQRVYIDAGRESTGYSRLYIGDITLVTLSQPPDIWTTIKAVTGQFQKGNIISTSEPAISSVFNIAKKAAESMDLSLQFEADDKQVANYGFTGAAEKQVFKIGELIDGDVYVDDEVLVVKNQNASLPGAVRIINADNGMIGMPEFVDFGIKVRFLFDNKTKVGDEIKTESEFYPATNGRYIIYKLDFDIANREHNFYYVAEARRKEAVIGG